MEYGWIVTNDYITYEGNPEWFARPDERMIIEQVHGYYRNGFALSKVPDPNGNVKMPVTASRLSEWLDEVSGSQCMVVFDDGNGPENGKALIFEKVLAYDDPDPYEVIVARIVNDSPTVPEPLHAEDVEYAEALGLPDKCEWCGETLDYDSNAGDGIGEFYDPNAEPKGTADDHKIGHYQCATDDGWVMA